MFGKIMFLAVALAGFFGTRAAFLILPRFCLESKLQRKMNAEEQQQLDGLKGDISQLKLALGNLERRFNELENRFDDLEC